MKDFGEELKDELGRRSWGMVLENGFGECHKIKLINILPSRNAV